MSLSTDRTGAVGFQGVDADRLPTTLGVETAPATGVHAKDHLGHQSCQPDVNKITIHDNRHADEKMPSEMNMIERAGESIQQGSTAQSCKDMAEKTGMTTFSDGVMAKAAGAVGAGIKSIGSALPSPTSEVTVVKDDAHVSK